MNLVSDDTFRRLCWWSDGDGDGDGGGDGDGNGDGDDVGGGDGEDDGEDDGGGDLSKLYFKAWYFPIIYEKHWWFLSDLDLDDARDELVSYTKVTEKSFQFCFSKSFCCV